MCDICDQVASKKAIDFLKQGCDTTMFNVLSLDNETELRIPSFLV